MRLVDVGIVVPLALVCSLHQAAGDGEIIDAAGFLAFLENEGYRDRPVRFDPRRPESVRDLDLGEGHGPAADNPWPGVRRTDCRQSRHQRKRHNQRPISSSTFTPLGRPQSAGPDIWHSGIRQFSKAPLTAAGRGPKDQPVRFGMSAFCVHFFPSTSSVTTYSPGSTSRP